MRSKWFLSHFLSLGFLVAGAFVLLHSTRASTTSVMGDNTDVLRAAYQLPNGGNYRASESGVLKAVVHHGTTILNPGLEGTNCSGVTFEVAMMVAAERGLIDKIDATRI